MEYNLYIDQFALKRWHGKIDAIDALIVGFIAGLNPHNPCVAKHMKGDYFRLSRDWILEEIPILTVSADWVGRKLAGLHRLGIIDLKTERAESAHHRTYGKLSRLYFAEVEKAKKHADKLDSSEGLQSLSANNVRGTTVPAPADYSPGDHNTYDHKETDAPPLSAAGAAPSEERDLSAPGPSSEASESEEAGEEQEPIDFLAAWRRIAGI